MTTKNNELQRPKYSMPSFPDLVERLRFSPGEGRIWMEGHRSILLSTSAFGAIRKELITRQGISTAREVLSLIGYAEGSRDAALARDLRPKATLLETFMAGPQAHALNGFGWTEVVDLQLAPERGTFFGEFVVHDSAEASTHLEVFGPSTECVCWMQSGYASGFVSAFIGRPVLIREVECRAMGHDLCRVIGRPLEEWDDSKPDTELYRPIRQPSRSGNDTGLGKTKDVIGISAGFGAAVHLVRKASPGKATLLFLGETGVGKEVFAQLAHRLSPRADKPFVAVNCGAIPESLIEAELFGVVRGAYTGATATRLGRFERANGGTLFLDEVATLSLPAQSKLLRALQEGEIERLGDSDVRHVDVRVIAAANVDLRESVKKGEFREDLYFRLSTFPVRIPPLRERRDDIPLLMEHFRKRHCSAYERLVPGFTARAVRALLAYNFPGNIRELEHRIERAVLLANDGEPIDLPHLFLGDDRPVDLLLTLDQHGRLRSSLAPSIRRHVTKLLANVGDANYSAIEHELLEVAVAEANGNLAAAARRLGLTRRQVAVRLEKLRRSSGHKE